MNNVTKLDAIVFVCACGCQSFRMHRNGVMECANCNQTEFDADSGRWLEKVSDIEIDPNAPTTGEVGAVDVKLLGNPEFARRSVIRNVEKWNKSNELALIVCYNVNGGGSHWFGIETAEQKQWVIDKLNAILNHVETMAVEDD